MQPEKNHAGPLNNLNANDSNDPVRDYVQKADSVFCFTFVTSIFPTLVSGYSEQTATF